MFIITVAYVSLTRWHSTQIRFPVNAFSFIQIRALDPFIHDINVKFVNFKKHLSITSTFQRSPLVSSSDVCFSKLCLIPQKCSISAHIPIRHRTLVSSTSHRWPLRFTILPPLSCLLNLESLRIAYSILRNVRTVFVFIFESFLSINPWWLIRMNPTCKRTSSHDLIIVTIWISTDMSYDSS